MGYKVPAVSQYMSSQAFTVGPLQTLQDARDMMVRARIHHLPVVDNGKLVGIVTSRDLDSAEHYADGNAASIRIDFAMAPEVYTVSPDTPLDLVAEHIFATHQGSAVVVNDSGVVGVFTMIDACRALRDVLRRTPAVRDNAVG